MPQPDGSEIQLVGWGNQFEAVFETPDDYTVVKNPETGFQHYATEYFILENRRRTGRDAGVYVSRSNGDGTFAPPQVALAAFGYSAGGWRVEKHSRLLADTTGDRKTDIVGFGVEEVWALHS